MRTSSFSNKQVVNLLSQYFVPVWLSNDAYSCEKSPAETAEYRRIQASARRQGLGTGTVVVFIIDKNGDPITTMNVGKAMEPENLLPLLRRVIGDKHLETRDPEAIRATARQGKSAPASQTIGGLLLHVWTCYLGGEADKGPGEDWLELTSKECATLLAPADSQPGDSWEVPAKVAGKLYQYFYPPVCNYDAKHSKMRKAQLTATLSKIADDETEVTLSGFADLDHSRDGTIDGRVNAAVIGVLRFNNKDRTITSFQMVSERADYIWHWAGRPNTENRIGIVVEDAKTVVASSKDR